MPESTNTIPVPTGTGAYYGPLYDWSGTVAAGGTAQQAVAANQYRRYLRVVNQSAHPLYVDFGTTATTASLPLAACATAGDGTGGALAFEQGFIPTGAVWVYGGTTGQPFTIKEG